MAYKFFLPVATSMIENLVIYSGDEGIPGVCVEWLSANALLLALWLLRLHIFGPFHGLPKIIHGFKVPMRIF